MNRFHVSVILGGMLASLALLFAGCAKEQSRKSSDAPPTQISAIQSVARAAKTPVPSATPHNPWEELAVRRVVVKDPIAAKIVAAARAQEGDFYDPSYQTLAYPNGDVAAGAGACTDVVIRALRGAGIDLQKLVHEDMKRDFRAYGDHWNLGRTDKNIDHRRVPNLMTFFARHGKSLTISTSKADLKNWRPGDIVTWKLPNNANHIGVVSNGIGARGLPLVIHNAQRCIEQDYLDAWPITGHYHYPK